MVKVSSGVQAGEVQIRRSEKKDIPSRVVKKGVTKEGEEGRGKVEKEEREGERT